MTDTIEEIQRRADAASPGPWFWHGNVDFGDVQLCRMAGPRERAAGVTNVLTHVSVERRRDDPRIHGLADHFDDPEEAAEEWMTEFGTPRCDDRLAFVENGMLVPARDRAVFQVCPAATKRDDPRVYRADIVRVRHPDAEFIAHAREDVRILLVEVARLRAALTERAGAS